MPIDLDAVRADLGSSRPKRRMRRWLPALLAELEAARRVCEALEAFRTLPADGSNRAMQALYRAHDAWRAVVRDRVEGGTHDGTTCRG